MSITLKNTIGCAKMQCPYCAHKDTKVIDKRDIDKITRRRRECLKCKRRFNTHEALEEVKLRVIKKDGCMENFDKEKIKRGIIKSCEKRPISIEQIDKMVMKVEEKLMKKGKEVNSGFIGDLVSRELKKVDKVAYIRFASVYHEFRDISDFKNEIRGLAEK